jgi:DNA-binding beta-propeller fold protein YncE
MAAVLVGTTLAAGEVVAAARVEPPGWAWSASTLLNAIHYQQPATVLGSLLALLVVAAGAGGAVALMSARGERLRGTAVLLLLMVVIAGCREVPVPPSGPHVQATRWFGAPGRGRGQFEYPRAMDIDPRDGTVLVVDRQARVQRFSPDGKFISEWSMPEKSLGKPTGIGVGTDGRVWVADTHYHRVICWSPDGKELLRIGEYGTGPGQFIYPCDVEVAPDNTVWVCEFGGNDRIQVFTPDGKFIRSIGGNGRELGQFDRPQSIGFSTDGREVYVADACNHRIQVLTMEGVPVRSFGKAGPNDGEMAYPYGLEVVPDGTVLVTEFGNHRVQRFNAADGRSLGTVRAVAGAPTPLVLHVIDGDRVRSVPSGENSLRFPWAIGVRGNQAFILDSGHSRVLVAPLDSVCTSGASVVPFSVPLR